MHGRKEGENQLARKKGVRQGDVTETGARGKEDHRTTRRQLAAWDNEKMASIQPGELCSHFQEKGVVKGEGRSGGDLKKDMGGGGGALTRRHHPNRS